MKRTDEIRDELKDIAPLLSEMDKKEVFKVPKDYFEALPDKILDQVRTETSSRPQKAADPVPGWIRQLAAMFDILLQPKYALSLASIGLLILAAVYIVPWSGENPGTMVEADVPSAEDISQYIAAHIEEFDTDLLLELTENETFDRQTLTQPQDDTNIDEYIDEIIDELDDGDLEDIL